MGVRKKKDILQVKQEELFKFQAQFNMAVSAMSDTIAKLCSINDGIAEKISEIDTYQEQLHNIKNGLEETRGRNDKVIQNFNVLLGNNE